MCALSALVMMELKCAIVVSVLIIGMELKARNCCSVCSMNDGSLLFCSLSVLPSVVWVVRVCYYYDWKVVRRKCVYCLPCGILF